MNYDKFSPNIKAKLDSLYHSAQQKGTNDVFYSIDHSTRINIPCGLDLYNLCMKVQPKNTLEIGLAYGFSTMYFLEAQQHLKFSHTAVDPAQFTSYNGIGYTSAIEHTIADKFIFHKMFSFECLSMLKMQEQSFEIIFIDGGHRFDDVLCDFTLAAQICPVGGYIILDDLLLPSITKVKDFIIKNRTDFVFEQFISTNLGFFKKISNHDERSWDHFTEF